MEENIPTPRKYTLKYLGIKDHDVYITYPQIVQKKFHVNRYGYSYIDTDGTNDKANGINVNNR